MDLGAFSVSLAVKDIEASKLFYGKLGFPGLVAMPSTSQADQESPTCSLVQSTLSWFRRPSRQAKGAHRPC
jgi:hypothetical protein